MREQKIDNINILYKLRAAFLVLIFVAFFSNIALAQEITAIDFNGEVIGKVIPDGKVVSSDNKLIGNINADSLIVNFEGELIGGIVPQGIAIGNDNKLFGKVAGDGTVRAPSGKVVGKVLTSGLVINDSFEIMGAVLFPGLIYSDIGEIVGRLIGDGSYINLSGQKIGFVSSDGYAYKQVGNEYILDGKLISSRMVVSNFGKFIGSVSPNGEVTDFESKVIGKIKANGFAYNSSDEVIGSIVKSGYAFSNDGKYLGFVTYNGEVINKEDIVGRALPNGKIVDLSNNVIGVFESFTTTFSGNNGEYLGRLLPNGNVAKANTIIGKMSANGTVVNDENEIIGQIIKSGPIYDYKGVLVGHSLKNGSVISISGSIVGKSKSGIAFDGRGRIIGAISKNNISIDFNNNILGVSDISSTVSKGTNKNIISPFGYVFSGEGSFVGKNIAMGTMFDMSGKEVALLHANGKVLNGENVYTGSITTSGYQIDEQNRVLGRVNSSKYISGIRGDVLGNVGYSNSVVSKNREVAKVLFDGSVVSAKDGAISYVNKVGQAYDSDLVVSLRGNLIGYAEVNGIVRDFSGYIIGQVVDRGIVIDNNNDFIGEIVSYSGVVNSSCEFLGVITPKGEVRNLRDTYIGKPLLNGQVISDSGISLGHIAKEGVLIDATGVVVGVSSIDGSVINYAKEKLGCINSQGVLKSSDGALLAKLSTPDYVIDFTGNIIGRNSVIGQVIDNTGTVIGYAQDNDNVNLKSGITLGNLFKYKYAFDIKNNLVGFVLSNGTVVNFKDKGELAKVDFNGNLVVGGEVVGYALYDLYIYDENEIAIGYISNDGKAMSFMGQNIGRIQGGFAIDNNSKLVGRGNRDYIIRAETYSPVGKLNLKGDLINSEGKKIGVLDDKDGAILNEKGSVIATANELQYYSRKVSTVPVYNQLGDLVGHAKDDGSVIDEDGKVIAILNDEGLAISANGEIIGGVGSNWYERARQVKDRDGLDIPSIGVIDPKVREQSKQSLRIALTPDGEFLGYINENNMVHDENGKYLGRKMPDGLIISDDGSLIGLEEIAGGGQDGEIFIPNGTFGPGGAYGSGTGPGSNLGPGGGYGPGERYDPMREAALKAAHGQRRQNIQVGKVSSNIRPSSFTGMQDDWSEQGIGRTMSSWRVDMSEMILADKPIPAVLSRSIDSNNPTPVTAYVERNVYAEVGRNIIIPAGSRVLGNLSGGMSAGTEATSQSAKIGVTWERLIRPDGSIFTFQGSTGDAQGRGGALGYLDQQLFKKYTLPLLTTALSSGTAYMMASAESDNDSGTESSRQQAASDARQNFLHSMDRIFNDILQDKMNIKPLTYVPAGTRIIIYPNVDLWLRNAEREKAGWGDDQRKDLLIDDAKTERDIDSTVKDRQAKRVVAGSSGGNVVYEYDDAGGEAEGPVLIDDMKSSNKNKGALPPPPPPPPPSTSSAPPPSRGSSNKSQSSGGSSGVPQLF